MSLDKLRATARAEVAAEDGIPADDYYDRFRRTSAEDFNKKHVPCAAHVVGIADPVKYRKRLEAVDFFKRQQEDWTAQLRSDGPSLKEMLKDAGNVTIADADPVMYGHASNQAVEFHNSRLKHQSSHERHDAGKAPSN